MPLSPSTLVFVAFNWLKFTASVPLVPLDTLVIGLLPALMPSLLMLTGPTVRLPFVVKLTSLFNEYVKFEPFCVKFKLSPAINLTSSPGLTN